jgi:hypothetical protein
MKKYDEAGKALAEAMNVLNEDNAGYIKSCHLQKINIKKREKKSENQPTLRLI